MSNIDFDDMSEQELAAIEASPTGDLFRATAQSLAPGSQLEARLEAHLRALPANKPAHAGANVSEKAPNFAGRANKQQSKPLASNKPGSGRIWRVASVGLGLAATLVLAFLLTGLFGTGRAGTAKDAFVLQGMVRHIVFEDKSEQLGTNGIEAATTYTSQQEVWLANGPDHLMMFMPGPSPEWDKKVWLLIDGTNVWYYLPPMGTLTDTTPPKNSARNTVYKTTFDSRQFNGIVPDKAVIDNLLQEPGYTLAGDDQVGGRGAFIVQSTGLVRGSQFDTFGGVPGRRIIGFALWPDRGSLVSTMSRNAQSYQGYDSLTGQPVGTPTLPPVELTPGFKVYPDKRSDQYRNEYDFRIWVDKETYRILQVETVQRNYGGEIDGSASKSMRSIIKDELLVESAAPKGLFTLKVPEGATIEDAYSAMVRWTMPYADEPANSDKGPSDDNTFVPQGKVRQMTFTASTVVTGTLSEPADKNLSGSSSIEVRVANENGQLLARQGNLSLGENWQLLTSDSFYDHPDPNSTTVYKYPYGEDHIRQISFGATAAYILPDPQALAYLLAEPNASTLGDTTLNGHTVTVISVPATSPSMHTQYADAPYRAMVDHWYWVESSTSRILRVEAAFTIVSGDKTGFRYGASMELSQEEVKDRTDLPTDYFTFTAPQWANVVDGTATATATATTSGTSNSSAPDSEVFVPDGKVRHLTLTQTRVITDTNGTVRREELHREDFWLAPGVNQDHYEMHTHATVPSDILTWVNGDTYYDYEVGSGNEIQSSPYKPEYEIAVVPDPNFITATLQQPGMRSLGETILDGRRALLIEYTDEAAAIDKSNPAGPSKGSATPSVPANTSQAFRGLFWIDLKTNQLLRQEHISTDTFGSVTNIINYTAMDELLDRSSLPANFFEPIIPADDSASSGALRVGDFAPDFTLTDVHTGKPVTLASLRGKPVVLNFWGTWCPPCKGAMAITQGVYNSVKGKAEIVGVSSGPRDDATLVKNYVDANKYSWTFTHDPDYSVSEAYKVNSILTYVFIDANGVIKAVKVGAITDLAEFSNYLGQIDPQLTVANPMGVPSADHPGWYVFTPFGGGFSVLMPKNLVDPSSRDGWEFYGVREGEALTYIAAYQDLEQTSDAKDQAKRLELMVPEASTFMNGTARSDRKSVALDGNPGLELMLDRTDGRFMRAKIYLVANRILLVYAIAQNEQALSTPEMDVYLDSLTLLNK